MPHKIPHDFKEDTTGAPNVHLKAVIPVGEQALGGSVPACGDVLCVWRLRVHAPTRAKIAKLQNVLLRVSQINVKNDTENKSTTITFLKV